MRGGRLGRRRACSSWCGAPIRIANLARDDFDAIVDMLSEGIAARRGRYGAYLHRDRVNRRCAARRGARLAAITSGGAIPDNALYTVVARAGGHVVGTLDEDFAVESLAGDVILLGNTSWRIRRVERGTRAGGGCAWRAAHVPFWRGEAPARTAELSQEVAELREEISERWPKMSTSARIAQTIGSARRRSTWLKTECGLDDAGGGAAGRIHRRRAARCWERCRRKTRSSRSASSTKAAGCSWSFMRRSAARINKAWGLALRKRFCRVVQFRAAGGGHRQRAEYFAGRAAQLSARRRLPFSAAEIGAARCWSRRCWIRRMFATRWRWDAGRALALLRFQGGKKVPPQIQRMRADDLLAAVFPEAAACQENIDGDIQIPDHPLVDEVMKDVLTEAMDIDGLQRRAAATSATARFAALRLIRRCRRSSRTRF